MKIVYNSFNHGLIFRNLLKPNIKKKMFVIF